MPADANADRAKEIELEITQQRAQIETSKRALENMRDDPDMLADAGVREGGRIKMAQERINELEKELHSLQNK